MHSGALTFWRIVQSLQSCIGTCASPAVVHGKSLLAMDCDEVKEMVKQGFTHRNISEIYQSRFPGKKGFSQRSVRRFCHTHGIIKPKDDVLDMIVRESVKKVGINALQNVFSSCRLAVS